MNILIFDTETIGKVSQDLLNVGYKICDVNIQQGTQTTLIERDYVITNLINNQVYCLNDDFVGYEKYSMYQDLLKAKKVIKRSIPQVFKTLANDLKKYNVLFGYAYNCNFDLDKFKRTALRFGIENPLEKLPVYDIWQYAYKYICNTENYIKWAKENEIFTESERYIQQNVESVCKYLYQDLQFVETHTALNDTQHETNILLECVRRGCDITRALSGQKNIPSEKVFTTSMKLPNGQEVSFEYTKEYKRNGKITYK